MFDHNAGQERTGQATYWPPREPLEGCGIVGKIAGMGNYTAKKPDGTHELVVTVKLTECVTYTPTDDGGKLRQELAVEVSINGDLRRKLDTDVLPVGTRVQIVYTGPDPDFNGMRRFRVSTVTATYHARLIEASSNAPADGMA